MKFCPQLSFLEHWAGRAESHGEHILTFLLHWAGAGDTSNSFFPSPTHCIHSLGLWRNQMSHHKTEAEVLEHCNVVLQCRKHSSCKQETCQTKLYLCHFALNTSLVSHHLPRLRHICRAPPLSPLRCRCFYSDYTSFNLSCDNLWHHWHIPTLFVLGSPCYSVTFYYYYSGTLCITLWHSAS